MRINGGNKDATNAQDKAIADAYGNKFIIPLDFEMLDSAAPYYQASLGNRLCYKLTFNNYNRVIKSAVSSPKVPDAKYKITDISLEYEIVTQPDLVRSIRSEYQHMALLYDRILRHIFSSGACTTNCIRLRINGGNKDATNAQDKAIADAYGNKFIIPLDFEMLDSAAPYYQASLGNRLCYKLTFNNYNRVIKSAVSSPKVSDAKYKITDISLEYEIVTQPDLARSIRSEYQHMALLYDRILRHRKIIVNKKDTVWNWAFNTPCKSLKGILVLFEEEGSYTSDTDLLSNMLRLVNISLKGHEKTTMLMRFRNIYNYIM